MTASSVGQPIPNTFITDSITSETYAFICQAIPLTHYTDGNKDKKRDISLALRVSFTGEINTWIAPKSILIDRDLEG